MTLSRRRRPLRWAAAGVAVVAILLVAHSAIVNRLLQARLEEILSSRRPGLLSVEWDSARSIVPGFVRVRGLTIRKQTRHVQWIAELDEARARIGLLGLLRKRFALGSLEGSGLSVRLRFRADPRPPDPGLAAAWDRARAAEPQFAEWTNPPDPPPEQLKGPLDPDRRRWRYTFEDAKIEGVRELWIGSHRFTGDAVLELELVDVQTKALLELHDLELRDIAGSVTVAGRPLASDIAGRISCTLPRQDLVAPASTMVAQLEGDADFACVLADLAPLGEQLRRIPGLELLGGTGPVEVVARLREGSFADGTRMEAHARDLRMRIFAGELAGDAQVTFRVDGGHGTGEAGFSRFELAHPASPPHVVGDDLRMRVATRDLDLEKPFEDVELSVSLASARVTSVAAYARWFPKGAPFTLAGGQGTLAAEVRLTRTSGSGRVHLVSRDVLVQAEELALKGALEVAAPLVAANPEAGLFDFSGTSVDVTDVSARSPRSDVHGWWGHVELPDLRLATRDDPMLEGRGTATFRDTEPIVAAWATEKLLARMFRGALTDDDVTVTSAFTAGRDGWSVEGLELQGAQMMARACLDVRPPEKRGLVYFDGGLLSVGIRLDENGRDVAPLARRAWWERNSSQCPPPRSRIGAR